MGDADAGTAWRSLTPPWVPSAGGSAAGCTWQGAGGARSGMPPWGPPPACPGHPSAPTPHGLGGGGHSRAQPPGTTRRSSMQGTALPLPAPLSMSAAGSLPAPEHPKRCEGPSQTPSCLPPGPGAWPGWGWGLGMGGTRMGMQGWGQEEGGVQGWGSRDEGPGTGDAGMGMQGWRHMGEGTGRGAHGGGEH